jgi:hypothetical protein
VSALALDNSDKYTTTRAISTFRHSTIILNYTPIKATMPPQWIALPPEIVTCAPDVLAAVLIGAVPKPILMPLSPSDPSALSAQVRLAPENVVYVFVLSDPPNKIIKHALLDGVMAVVAIVPDDTADKRELPPIGLPVFFAPENAKICPI